MAFDIVLRDNGAGSFDISLGVATDNINPTLVTNTPSVLSPNLEGTITPGLTTNTPSVLSPSLEGTLAPDLVTNTPTVPSPAIEGTITPGLTTRTPTVNSPTLSGVVANLVGHAVNSGTFGSAACFGLSPTTAVYHEAAENTQAGMILLGKKLYTDAACTTPVNGNFQWWAFSTTSGASADRAIQISSDGTVLNGDFQNGVVFGYAKSGGACGDTTGFDACYNGPDDYQFWYPRKIAARSATADVLIASGTQALAYTNAGPVIGTATFEMINNYQHSYTAMTPCGGGRTRRVKFVPWF